MKSKISTKLQAGNQAFEVVTGLEELNWVEFPLALLTKNPDQHLKTLRFQDTIRDSASGELIERRVLVSAADALSLPTWQDQDVLLALMKYTNDLNRFESPIVPFTLYKILKLLRWPDNGAYRQRLKTALQRWNATWIRFENAFRREDRWTTEKGFHVISFYELNDAKSPDPDREQYFEWHRVVFESIQARHTKGFDWEFYLGLRLPSTKRLFRFLDKRFWRTPKYSPLLVPFCQEKLGMSRSYKANRYRDLLTPAIEELSTNKFLTATPASQLFERVQHGVYRVHFHKYRRPPTVTNEPSLVQELMSRGIAAAEAKSLVAKFDCARIRDQLDHFDAQRRKLKSIGPGWLREAIVRKFTLPPDMETTSQAVLKKELAEKASAVVDSARNARDAAVDHAQAIRESELRTYINSLSRDDVESLWMDALKLGSPLLRSRYEASIKAGNPLAECYREQLLFRFIEGCGIMSRQPQKATGS